MTVTPGATAEKTIQAEYDFAIDGGAIGTITLRQTGSTLPNLLPTGSVIVGGYIEVLTTLTSGGAATVGINSEAAGDIKAAATAFTVYATTGSGIVSILPSFGTTAVKTTAARSLAITIAAATVTAGKFRVVVFYK
jgi:hypothetical protein